MNPLKSSYLSFYFDEDVSVKIAYNLRNRGFDVITTVEADNLGSTDKEQLEYASKNKRVFFTHNIKHFIALHSKYVASGGTHSGIVLAVRNKNPNRLVIRLLQLLHSTIPADMQNQIRFL